MGRGKRFGLGCALVDWFGLGGGLFFVFQLWFWLGLLDVAGLVWGSGRFGLVC